MTWTSSSSNLHIGNYTLFSCPVFGVPLIQGNIASAVRATNGDMPEFGMSDAQGPYLESFIHQSNHDIAIVEVASSDQYDLQTSDGDSDGLVDVELLSLIAQDWEQELSIRIVD